MKIGVLGTGNVGQTLAAGFAALGHDVKLGSRTPHAEKVRSWLAKTGPRASAGTYAEAATFGELAVVATAWVGTEQALRMADAKNLAGKVVIDVTNPIAPSTQVPELAVGHKDSGGEQVQRWLPAARVVKAFNTVGYAHMVKPQFPGGPPDMFLCGNDEGGKRVVAELCSALGWSPIDVGGIDAARLLEPLAMLWVRYGVRTGTWSHAFKLLRK